MRFKARTFFLLLVFALQTNADWFCTESAGRNSDGIYQSCGIGEDRSEAQARALAFDAAKAEFNRVCNEDVKCKTSSKSLELKRTECKKSPGGYKCYRMLEYILTEADPVSAASAEIIQQELEKKQKQLVELRKRSIELERLKMSDKEIELEQMKVERLAGNNSSEIQKDIDRLTVEVENGSNQSLTIKPFRTPDRVFRVSISGSGSTLKGHSYDLASYRLEFERRFTSLFGVNIVVDPYAVGENKLKEKYTSMLLAIGFPLYVYKNFYLRPEAVQRSTKYSPTGNEQNFNQTGYGFSIGYDFTELTDNWDAGISLNVGYHTYQSSGATEGNSVLSGAVGLAISY